MKLLGALLITFAMNTQANAGGTNCVVTDLDDNSTINLFIDHHPDGLTLKFDKAVSWSKTALEFPAIYSTLVGNTSLTIAVAADGREHYADQVIELYFERTIANGAGTMKAGDLRGRFSAPGLGKFREYSVVCS